MMGGVQGTPCPDERDDSAGRDDRAADGVQHLQRAAREVIAAARSFLDAAERVVEDDAALRDASATVGDLVTSLLEPLRPGTRAPWFDEGPRRSGAGAADRDGPARATPDVEPSAANGHGDGPEDVDEAAEADDTEEWARPLVDADAPRRPSRVRRIAVD